MPCPDCDGMPERITELQEQLESAQREQERLRMCLVREQEIGSNQLAETIRLRNGLRGIAHMPPPPKDVARESLAEELAAARLTARTVLDEWGSNPASTPDAQKSGTDA